jgi:hypothetical protein
LTRLLPELRRTEDRLFFASADSAIACVASSTAQSKAVTAALVKSIGI